MQMSGIITVSCIRIAVDVSIARIYQRLFSPRSSRARATRYYARAIAVTKRHCRTLAEVLLILFASKGMWFDAKKTNGLSRTVYRRERDNHMAGPRAAVRNVSASDCV